MSETAPKPADEPLFNQTVEATLANERVTKLMTARGIEALRTLLLAPGVADPDQIVLAANREDAAK